MEHPPKNIPLAARRWCDDIAPLSVDALVSANLVAKGDYDKAQAVVSEEVFVRLCLSDYPPRPPEGTYL